MTDDSKTPAPLAGTEPEGQRSVEDGTTPLTGGPSSPGSNPGGGNSTLAATPASPSGAGTDSYHAYSRLRSTAKRWTAVSHLNNQKLENWLRFDADQYADKVPADIASGDLGEARQWLRIEGAAKKAGADEMLERLEAADRQVQSRTLTVREAAHNASVTTFRECADPACTTCSDLAYERSVGK
jgi:hypothetical protein